MESIQAISAFQPEGFPLTMFKDRYAFTLEETWEAGCLRWARQAALAEAPEKVEKYTRKFNDIFVKNLMILGGRSLYSSGRINPQLLNCFVIGGPNLDSKEGWGTMLRENCITSMTGGGVGADFSDIRPYDSPIKGHRGTSSGPLGLMYGVNSVADMVRAGGGRRAANMFSLDLHHPDVHAFLDAKLVKGELALANISVRSLHTEKFIEAVKKDKTWELSWKGQHKKYVSARGLWEKIVKNSWDSGEPGFLNMELALRESTISYLEDLSCTNPCGEIFLEPYSCCCLGHLVLPRFIQNGAVNWPLLGEVARLGVRCLDNILDVNTYPLEKMKEIAQKRRRIGLGVTGLADFLTMQNLKYGSEKGNALINKLFRFISKAAYESSVMLAVEKGMFPDCKPELHVKTGFVERMTPKIKSTILEHGIRNCALITIAPTGTTSIVSGNCSSGVEPAFAPAYYRNFWKGDKRAKELCFHPLFAEAMKEGNSVDHFAPACEVGVQEHMEVQKIIQHHTDNAVSKTINIPKDYPKDKLSELWLRYLPHLKGMTIYREGSRNYIDDAGVEHDPPLVAIPLKEAVRLYKQQTKAVIEAAPVDDCASGTCELPPS